MQKEINTHRKVAQKEKNGAEKVGWSKVLRKNDIQEVSRRFNSNATNSRNQLL